jgi:hypothetical protein
MQTFIVEPRHFARLIEGRIRHYIAGGVVIVEDDEITIFQRDTQRKAIFQATHVDKLDDGCGGTYYVASLKLQEWASPDTA